MAFKNKITSEEAINTLGVNAKPHIIKRLVAGLIDMVILFFFHYGLYSLILITPMANTLKSYQNEIVLVQEDIKVEAGYSQKEIVDSTYNGQSVLHYDEPNNTYYIVVDIDFKGDSEAQKAAANKYQELINASEHYSDVTFKYHLHNYVITALFCGGITELIFLLIIPLIMNCGQTLGMMIMSIRMYNAKYVGKPKWYQYLGRFAFIFIVLSLIPFIFLAEWILLVVPGVTILVMFINKQNRALEDFVSGISFVEKKTFVDSNETIEEDEPKVVKKDNA